MTRENETARELLRERAGLTYRIENLKAMRDNAVFERRECESKLRMVNAKIKGML